MPSGPRGAVASQAPPVRTSAPSTVCIWVCISGELWRGGGAGRLLSPAMGTSGLGAVSCAPSPVLLPRTVCVSVNCAAVFVTTPGSRH